MEIKTPKMVVGQIDAISQTHAKMTVPDIIKRLRTPKCSKDSPRSSKSKEMRPDVSRVILQVSDDDELVDHCHLMKDKMPCKDHDGFGVKQETTASTKVSLSTLKTKDTLRTHKGPSKSNFGRVRLPIYVIYINTHYFFYIDNYTKFWFTHMQGVSGEDDEPTKNPTGKRRLSFTPSVPLRRNQTLNANPGTQQAPTRQSTMRFGSTVGRIDKGKGVVGATYSGKSNKRKQIVDNEIEDMDNNYIQLAGYTLPHVRYISFFTVNI